MDTAFDLFRSVLAQNNFRVQGTNSDSLVGTHSSMMQKGDNALRGATPISLTRRNKALELEAEFGGVKKASRFVLLFPLGLGAFLAVVFGILFGASGMMGDAGYAFLLFPLLLGASLAFGFRSIARSYRDRAVAAVETLAGNLAEVCGGRISAESNLPSAGPSAASLAFSTALFLPALIVASFAFRGGAGKMMDDSNRVVLPSQQTVRVRLPGTHTIFYEYRAYLNGTSYNTPRSWSRIELSLRSAVTGEAVSIEPIRDYSNYEQGNRAGYSIARFQAERPGDYILTARGIPEGETRVVSVAHFDSGRVLWLVFGLLILVTLGGDWVYNLTRYVSARRRSALRIA
jgi:hypothetical protein